MSDNFGYCKVGTVITLQEAVEKSPILLLQYWKNKKMSTKIYCTFLGHQQYFRRLYLQLPIHKISINKTYMSENEKKKYVK